MKPHWWNSVAGQIRLPVALGGIAGLNVLLGFAYQWHVVTTLGAGRQTDAILAGMLIPQLVLSVASVSLMNVLVPLFSAAAGKELRRDSWTIFTAVGLVSGGAAAVLGLSAGLWVPAFVPGFDAAAVELTISVTRIQLLGMVCTTLSAVLGSLSHARRQFVRVELAMTFANAAAIGFLVLYLGPLGPYAVAWGFTLRAALQMLLLIRSLGAVHAPQWRRGMLAEAWVRVRPLLLGALYHKSDFLVDRYLASMAPAGGMTLLALAQQIYGAGYSILEKAISGPTAPLLVRSAGAGQWTDFQRIYARRVRVLVALAVASYLVLLVGGEPALRLLIGYGNISAANVRTLWLLLVLSGGAWLLAPAGRIMSLTFYSVGNTRTPTIVGAAAFTSSILLRVALFAAFGLQGLALAMSLHYVTAVVLMLAAMRAAPAFRAATPLTPSS